MSIEFKNLKKVRGRRRKFKVGNREYMKCLYTVYVTSDEEKCGELYKATLMINSLPLVIVGEKEIVEELIRTVYKMES